MAILPIKSAVKVALNTPQNLYSVLYPQIHMLQNGMRFLPWSDCKEVTCDLKRMYWLVAEKVPLASLTRLMPNNDSTLALNYFMVVFDERLSGNV
jgi:hypothetical protein